MMMFPSIYNNDFFDDLFDLPVWNDRDMKKAEKKLYGHNAGNLMKTDIKEKDKEYELHIDLPGFDKDEIQVSLDNGYITIQASKGLDKDEDEKDGKWIHKERYAGSCMRQFYVGDGLVQEDIKAEFKGGILKVTVPKKEALPDRTQNKYIAIEG